MDRRMAGRAVYSTDPSFEPPCEVCGQPPAACTCRPAPLPPPEAQAVRIRLDRKGRGGKVVTVIDGLFGSPESIRDLARALKEDCGTGGTVRPAGETGKGSAIELQGDHRDRAEAALAARGYRPKRSGG